MNDTVDSSDKSIQEVAKDAGSNFGDMSADEQLDVIRTSFFGGEEHDRDEPGNEAGNEAGGGHEESAAAENERESQSGTDDSEHHDDAPEAEPTRNSDSAGKAEPALYSAQEFLLEDPESVDRSRLPEAARVVHDRYMEVYRTQLAPRLRELEELKAKSAPKPDGKTGNAAEAEAGDDEKFNALVRNEAARRLGVDVSDLDDFDSKHVIMMSRVAAALEQRRTAESSAIESARRGYAEAMRALRAKYSDFDVIDRWALSEMDNLPHGVHEQVLAGLRSGNAETVANIFTAFAERYHSLNGGTGAKRPARQSRAEPPSVLSGSNGDDRAKRSWGVREFARGSSKEKARMLIDGGFLDD